MNKFSYILNLIVATLSTLVPKNKKNWVFGSWFGKQFSDNSKYLYNYVSQYDEDINVIWIGKNKKVIHDLRNQGVNAYYYKSLLGIYYQARASVVFFTHSVGADLNPLFIGYTTFRVQLWHGMALKKIGFDNDKVIKSTSFSIKHPKLYEIISNTRNDMIISTGKECTKVFSSAFRESSDKIFETGFPRNDVFTKPRKVNRKYRAIYMPTFRDVEAHGGDLFEKYQFDAQEIDKLLVANSIDLYIRVHPANSPSDLLKKVISECQSIQLFTVPDIYEAINSFDCLITDYSSIMFDFSLSGRSMIFAPFDLKDYLASNRDLYFDYESIIPANDCYFNWPTLIGRLIEEKKNQTLKNKEFSSLLSFHDVIETKKDKYSLNVYEAVKRAISLKNNK